MSVTVIFKNAKKFDRDTSIIENSMKIIADVTTDKCLNIVRSCIHELQATGIQSHISMQPYVCRSSWKGRHPSPKFYNWHLEFCCQPHWCPEPDSLVNWQRFHFLARSTGVLRVTYCTAAAVFQTYANMFEIWHPDTSEGHVVVKDRVRNKAKAMEDSQTKAHCKHSLLAYSTNNLQTLHTNSCHLEGSGRM